MGKALYQAKLILESLPSDELALIPKQIIDYVKNNATPDPSIKIDPSKALDEQPILHETKVILAAIIRFGIKK